MASGVRDFFSLVSIAGRCFQQIYLFINRYTTNRWAPLVQQEAGTTNSSDFFKYLIVSKL